MSYSPQEPEGGRRGLSSEVQVQKPYLMDPNRGHLLLEREGTPACELSLAPEERRLLRLGHILKVGPKTAFSCHSSKSLCKRHDAEL